MNLIFLGPPGAGKGTQAAAVSGDLKVPHISTGDMFRKAISEGTPTGLKAKSFMDAGALVPDEVIIGILADALGAPECANGYILDGVPRTIPQAEAMEQQGVDIDWAVDLEVEDEVIIERMSGRRTCVACGASYHVVNAPSKVEGICDACGGELTIRKDDAPETVRARLETYHSQTEPLIAFYRERGKLKTVMNQPSIEATTAEICKALGI